MDSRLLFQSLSLPSINNIHQELHTLNAKCQHMDLDIHKDKWILFSDHHRGIGDGADDFAPCKDNYLSALGYYLANDYGLIILGDAEEFWENTLKSVISKYKTVLEEEKKFHLKNKLIKIWGNHDDAWDHLNEVSRYLFPFFEKIKTHEAIRLSVNNNGTQLGQMLLVHGHQGSRASDRFAGISKWFVRVIWRNVQRLFKIPLSTPSKSKVLKTKHDIAMHTWAKSMSKQIVICGHTHQPVFMSRNHLDILVRELEGLDHDDEKNMTRIAEIENQIKKLNHKTTAIGTLVYDKKPCYFNTGCCSFADGDITGIELAEGEIRLVKWSNHSRTAIDKENITSLYDML